MRLFGGLGNLKYLLFVTTVFGYVESGALTRSPYLPPPICDETCSSEEDCDTECYESMMEFENGNSTTCYEYGVYDSSDPSCCGDNFCNTHPDHNEAGSCQEDCGGGTGCNPAQCTPGGSGCGSGQVCNAKACCIDVPVGDGDPPKNPPCYSDSCFVDGQCCGDERCYRPHTQSWGWCVPDIVPPPPGPSSVQ